MALIELAVQQKVAWLKLNNPENHNALSLPLLQELEATLDNLKERKDFCCLVIYGAGKSFCAGGDLAGFKQDLESQSPAFIRRLEYAQVVLNKIETFVTPTLAAVHGYAIAGGLELILCCDLVIASRSARIGDGHARYGIIPAAGSSVRLRRKIPPNLANYLLYSAALVDAGRLESWGLLNHVADDENLLSTAQRYASEIATHSPAGLRTIKQLLTKNESLTPTQALGNEIKAFEDYQHTYDLKEGLQAFEEKRQPEFRGY